MKSKALITLIVIAAATTAVYFFANRNRAIRNVILISMDTTRADHLSCYGYKHKTTPNIDAFAEHAYLFENAVSPVPMTLPAHSSMLTGTIPPCHGVHDNIGNSLSDSNLTITEVLQENGFATAAVIGAYVLDSGFGLDQGFDYYNDQFEKKPDNSMENERLAEEVTEKAIGWVEQNKDEKFFMFLHYYDPHAEYAPPEPFASRFKSNPYAGEIAYTDHCIGKVLDKLKELNVYDSSLIVIVGDHGEMFGEHGELGHSYFIYQPALRVPLIVKTPNQQNPNHIELIAGVIDIPRTICSVLGLEIPDSMQGKDLLSLKETDDERYLYCESLTPTKYGGNSLLGLIGGKHKYIETTKPELYDLIGDPDESKNIIESRPNLARILQDKLKQTIESALSNGQTDSKIELDDESIKRLESLGYVGGEITEDFSFDRDRKDPKDMLEVYQFDSVIAELIRKGKYDQAKKKCLKILETHPDIEAIYSQLVNIAQEQNDKDAIVNYLKKLVELKPDTLQYNIKLADVYIAVEKYDLALEKLQGILKQYPNQPYAHTKLGMIFMEQKNFQEGLFHLNESLRLDPHQTIALNQLANIYHLQNDTAKTVEYINKSLSIKSNQPKILDILAMTYYSQGDIYRAVETWQRILKFAPDNIDANNSIAWIKATSKDKKLRDPSQAIILAKNACRLTEYKDPAMLDSLAAAYACASEFDKAVETARKGIATAKSSGNTALASRIAKRLSLYQNNKPYFE